MSVPYERIVQWSAGPIAALAGWLATRLVANVSLFGSMGIGKNQIAQAIVTAVTFAVTAGVTYAAHHKWLSNLPQWWLASGLTTPSGVTPSDPTEAPPVAAAATPTAATNGTVFATADDLQQTEARIMSMIRAMSVPSN